MMMTRRGVLAAGTAVLATAKLPAFAQQQPAIRLAATSRALDVNGRAATVFGLAGPTGQGLTLDPGQRFRVDSTNDLPEPTLVNGAWRDTIYVPSMSMATVDVDAGEAARWMLHCHHMPHLETGMMTEFQVKA